MTSAKKTNGHTHESPSASTSNPSTAFLEGLVQQVDAIAASFGGDAKPLTIADRRRLLKIRPGGPPHAHTAVTLLARYGLAIPGVDAAAVAEDVRFVEDVATLLARLDVVRGFVNDMSLQAQSRIWRAGTTSYAMLTRLVPQFPALQRELTPMASFLARQYKDAPTALRKQEKGALQRGRAKRKKAQEQAQAQEQAHEQQQAPNAGKDAGAPPSPAGQDKSGA